MEEPKDLNCETCGGTEFMKDGGFYYCTECQTQSQEIQERIYEKTDNVPVIEKKIAINKNVSVNNKNKLTTWETYNYILYGLVQELQNLGADENFKEITYNLWMKYLTNLEYITENNHEPAKLGVVYKKRDAEIVFERRFKRKRKKNNVSSITTSDMDDKMKHSEKRKRRRQMEKAEYDALSSTFVSDSTSLANQTLSGLSSEGDTAITGEIKFNESSRKELLRYMTPAHLKKHMQDINNEMTCHKIPRQYISQSFLRGPQTLTKNKLYCLIYLGMLLSEQDFQISDLIRYCREGHLSFLDYKYMFPDEVDLLVDHTVYNAGKKELPSYDFFRTFTFQLHHYLNLLPCDLSPDLLKLCRRYCTELNLPDEFFNIVGNFINKTRPYYAQNNPKCIPNYEGRAMAFIIYLLKVLFGFDDVTEYELSKFAKLINDKNSGNTLFNFVDWFNYIEYRKIVVKHVHFPTWFLLHPDRECPLELYTNYLDKRKNSFEIADHNDLSINIAVKYLKDLELLQDISENYIDFEPSFTPFRTKIEKLKTIPNIKILNQTLNYDLIKDASNFSIDYLIDPNPYLKQIKSKKCKIIFNNAHPKHKLCRFKPYPGNFEQKTYDHWEENLEKKFQDQKRETLSLDVVTMKMLKKRLHNIDKKNSDILNETPKVIEVPEDEKFTKIKSSIGRNSQGRFCKKGDPEEVPETNKKSPRKGKWHVSSWNKTILEVNYNPSLFEEVNKEEMNQEKSTQNEKCLNGNKYKYHYMPRMEYIMNFRDAQKMSNEKYIQFEETLPKNFQWLLKECARTLEQSTKELYQEFCNVEIYMNYVHFKKLPIECKPLSNDKIIYKMIRNVRKIW